MILHSKMQSHFLTKELQYLLWTPLHQGSLHGITIERQQLAKLVVCLLLHTTKCMIVSPLSLEAQLEHAESKSCLCCNFYFIFSEFLPKAFEKEVCFGLND